jgi:hypothetical protein
MEYQPKIRALAKNGRRFVSSIAVCLGAACAVIALSLAQMPSAAGGEVDCEQLSQNMDLQCLSEPHCVYDGSWCVPTSDPCEIAWPELEGTQASCEAMTQCNYIAEEPCYCPPDVDCVCGGGAPQQCRLDG